jgi:hypothetical protein
VRAGDGWQRVTENRARTISSVTHDQAFILDRWGKKWVVYYTERGEKTYISQVRIRGRRMS